VIVPVSGSLSPLAVLLAVSGFPSVTHITPHHTSATKQATMPKIIATSAPKTYHVVVENPANPANVNICVHTVPNEAHEPHAQYGNEQHQTGANQWLNVCVQPHRHPLLVAHAAKQQGQLTKL
jgi:hypothetical protein